LLFSSFHSQQAFKKTNEVGKKKSIFEYSYNKKWQKLTEQNTNKSCLVAVKGLKISAYKF
jgi:hypothetical protein